MEILNLLQSQGPAIYYEPNFRKVLLDHKTFLMNHPDTKTIQLNSSETYSDESDMMILLVKNNIPLNLHFIIMFLNNFSSFNQNTWENTKELKIPSEKVIDKIRTLYMVENKLRI